MFNRENRPFPATQPLPLLSVMRAASVALVTGLGLLVAAAAHQSWPRWHWTISPPPPDTLFHSGIHPFVSTSCYECHDSVTARGGFDLERLNQPASLSEDRDAWQRVLTHVSHGLMPPADGPAISPRARAAFVDWLDRALHPVDPRRPDPGRAVIRRLNRSEYRHAVQDIFGVSFDPTTDFPPDDSGYGFDHIADVLTLSPLLVEQLMAAAERVAAAVIPDPEAPPGVLPLASLPWAGSEAGEGLAMRYSNGTVSVATHLPQAGRYRLLLDLYQDRAGDEPAKATVSVNGRSVGEVEANGSRQNPRRRTVEADLVAGRNEIALHYFNDFYLPAQSGRRAQDRNFYLADARLEGPLHPPGKASSLPDWVGPLHEDESRRAWTERTLAPIVRLAWRRTPESGELRRLADLVLESGRAGDNLPAALQVALQAILLSPNFLFIGEPSPPEATPGRPVPISDHALATRLAFFLWNGPPDTALLDLAASGKLRENLSSEADRLLADPRAARFLRNFTGQWLHVRNLPFRSPDPSLHPEWSPALARTLEQETYRFMADFLTNGRPVTEMLTAGHTFADADLAAYYGLDFPAGEDGIVRLDLPPGRRAGLLGQAGVLTVTSYPNRTSPVLRGVFVLEQLLGTPPPPAPADIPSLAEDDDPHAELTATLRERLERHRAEPSCAACHALFDPIGFALEGFDALGRPRTHAGGLPIETSGTLTSGRQVDSAESLARALATERRGDFRRALARKLLTYALGRGLDYYDRPAVDEILRRAAREGDTLPAYLHAVVASFPFQHQRGPDPSEADPGSPLQSAFLAPSHP
ncbi:MAG: DUF1592 domain-containing protein [Puniceicoccaceae bacterium]|nr:MAG: DUF1592 domain-containing protein [Puniceicoccaceae bacterium]